MTDRLFKGLHIGYEMCEFLLACPECGETCGMHHYHVADHVRRREDGCTETFRSGVFPHVGEPLLGNPSSRRGGVAVRFYCECCPAVSELCLAQHKGATFVYWRRVPLEEER